MTRSKLTAFTISEMLIVMVIASILLSAATLIYDNVNRYQFRMKDRVEKVNALNRFQYLISRDLKTNKDWKLTSGKFTSENANLLYEFHNDSIVRYQSGLSESFPLAAQFDEVENGYKLQLLLYEQPVVVNFTNQQDYRSVLKSQVEK